MTVTDREINQTGIDKFKNILGFKVFVRCDNLDALISGPLLLIIAVLGSILAGIATPTEAASVGAMGAILLAISQRQFNLQRLREVMQSTTRVTSMVFLIFIGASIFSLVFRPDSSIPKRSACWLFLV